MTVKEMIEILKKYPEDAEVFIAADEGVCNEEGEHLWVEDKKVIYNGWWLEEVE